MFSARWYKANSLGWFLGVLFILLLSSTFDSIGLEGFQFFIGLGISSSLGIVQWWAINKHTPISKKWIITTILGLSVPFILFDILSKLNIINLEHIYLPVTVSAGALVVSLLQNNLINKLFSTKSNWFVYSLVGWLIIGLLVYGVEYTQYIPANRWVLFSINLLALISGGFIIGLFTYKPLKKALNIG